MGAFFKSQRTRADFQARKLRGGGFGHAQPDSGAPRGFAHGNNMNERRRAFDQRESATGKLRLLPQDGLHGKIRNVNGREHLLTVRMDAPAIWAWRAAAAGIEFRMGRRFVLRSVYCPPPPCGANRYGAEAILFFASAAARRRSGDFRGGALRHAGNSERFATSKRPPLACAEPAMRRFLRWTPVRARAESCAYFQRRGAIETRR